MSLYGALFGGVSGLKAQSSKIGAISDNIANVNTTGYKQASATFSSLVVNSSSAVSYQTGGVRAGTELDVSKQGLLQATESPTDLAISGGGFFVVRGVPDGSVGGTAATPYYTRAGSFTPDALGNYVNSQGFYLQGWPLDRDGRLPGEVGNLNTTSSSNFDSLRPVNLESASGVAQGTSTIALGANLKSSEVVYPGEAGTISPDNNTSANLNQPADSILVSSEFSLATANSVRRGDRFTVSTGNGLQYDYEYGGYTIGRNVTVNNGAVNFGDGLSDNTALADVSGAADVQFVGGSSFYVTIPSHNMIDGDTITLSGFGAVGATPAAQMNATHVITRVDADTVQITVATAHGGGGTAAVPVNTAGAVGATADYRQFNGNVLDAASTTQTFLGQIGTSGFTANARKFTITTATAGVRTFTYSATAPNTLSGEFNNLNSLATAINSVIGLTARVVSGRLVVGAEDASEAVTFANLDATGTATQRGIDWVTELGLDDVAIGNRRFSSIQGLSDIVTADDGVSATVNNPLSSATMELRVDDPLDTISFDDLPVGFTVGTDVTIVGATYAAGAAIDIVITNAAQPTSLNAGDYVYLSGITNGVGGLPGYLPNGGPYQVVAQTAGDYTVRIPAPYAITIAGAAAVAITGTASVESESNQGSLLSQLGLMPSLDSVAYTGIPLGTGALGPRYDPTGTIGLNLASGDIVAQFSRNVRVYDSLGSGHDLRFSFIKVATNTWALEVHAIPETDISTTLVDGQIATGTINFNGDGTLRSVSASLAAPIDVVWTNGSVSSTITLDLGTAGQPFGTVGAAVIGLTDGLSQFDSAYNVNFANQNGAPVGQLVSVAVDKEGIVSASYSNGQTQQLFQLPLAAFASPNSLNAVSGNIFAQTRESGEVNLRVAGNNGTGSIVSAALEASNVDLAEQLTDIIVAQRSYQANTKVIKTSDELLQALNQI